MLRLSNLADYGVVVMTSVARESSATGLVSAAQVADGTGIPLPTVSKLLGQLTRAGLLHSYRGVAGGFALASRPEAVRLVDIVEAIDGPIALTHCGEPGEPCCELADSCLVRPHWAPVNQAVHDALAAVSLAELLPEAQKILA